MPGLHWLALYLHIHDCGLEVHWGQPQVMTTILLEEHHTMEQCEESPLTKIDQFTNKKLYY